VQAVPTAYLDFAGSADVRTRLRGHLGGRLQELVLRTLERLSCQLPGNELTPTVGDRMALRWCTWSVHATVKTRINWLSLRRCEGVADEAGASYGVEER
jgi:hypothetical protein